MVFGGDEPGVEPGWDGTNLLDQKYIRQQIIACNPVSLEYFVSQVPQSAPYPPFTPEYPSSTASLGLNPYVEYFPVPGVQLQFRPINTRAAGIFAKVIYD
eukprot:scaffold21686_cov22-Cyclotella_meneghiniana.AAC.1